MLVFLCVLSVRDDLRKGRKREIQSNENAKI